MTDLIIRVAIAGLTIGFVLGVIVALIVVGLCAGCMALRKERKAARQLGELVVALLLLVLSASAASAEPTWPLKTKKQQQAANVASYITLGALEALDTFKSAKADRPGRAFAIQGARLGVTYGGTLLTKSLVHRARPCAPDCGIDNPQASFFSGHSAGAAQAIDGDRLSLTLSLALGTGGLRELANKHHWTDIAVGWLAGYGVRKGVDYAASRWF
jgi:membrane-associated phospholipid phosphatase